MLMMLAFVALMAQAIPLMLMTRIMLAFTVGVPPQAGVQMMLMMHACVSLIAQAIQMMLMMLAVKAS